jgi:hypothetical protein
MGSPCFSVTGGGNEAQDVTDCLSTARSQDMLADLPSSFHPSSAGTTWE